MDNTTLSIAEEYIEFGTFVYDELYQAYWSALPNTNNRLALTEQIIDEYKDILSDDISESALDNVQFLAKQYGAIEAWDEKKFKTYKGSIINNNERELLNTEGTNIRFLAFLRAIQLVTESIETVYDNLKQGKGNMQGDLFIIEGIRNPLFTLNADDFEDVKTTCYNQLVATLENKITTPFADKRLLIETELKEFTRLFNPHESSKGWEYLMERLFLNSVSDVEELYQMRMKIMDGTYVHSLLETGDDQRVLCGKLFAIKEYVEYLKQSLRTKEKKDGVLLLPDLLKNKDDINVIDAWLSNKEFIELHDGNNACPYKWVGLNDNEGHKIYSKVNDHSVETSVDKKVRVFSLRNQIAAFGYWLHDTGRLSDKIYNATEVAKGVLTYYNIKVTGSNIKAFTEKNIDNLNLYSVYYDGLIISKKPF